MRYLVKTATEKNLNKATDIIVGLFNNMTEAEIIKKDDNRIEILRKTSDKNRLKDDDRFRKEISEVVARYIANNYYKETAKGIIDKECGSLGFDITEIKTIHRQINDTLFKPDSAVNKGLICEIKRRIEVCLEDSTELDVEGFIRFRLKDLLDNIKIIIDGAISECIIEHEYNEFIGLLRYFVQTQWPKVEEAHIYFEQGEYVLCEKNHQPIENLFIEEIRNDDIEMTKEDMLIGSLITLAPQRIIVHDSNKLKDKEIISTISKVFEKQVVLVDELL